MTCCINIEFIINHIIIMVVFNVLHQMCFNSVVHNMKLFLHWFGLFASSPNNKKEESNEKNTFHWRRI